MIEATIIDNCLGVSYTAEISGLESRIVVVCECTPPSRGDSQSWGKGGMVGWGTPDDDGYCEITSAYAILTDYDQDQPLDYIEHSAKIDPDELSGLGIEAAVMAELQNNN